MSYVVSIEGQKIPLPEEIGKDDNLVRQALAPYFPDAAHALISRSEKNGETTISVVKKAGSKGTDPVAVLVAAPAGMNPVIELYDEINRSDGMSVEQLLEMDGRIDAAIEEGEQQNQAVEHALKRLQAAQPAPAPLVVMGF